MQRRSFLSSIAGAAGAAAQSSRPPNVLFLLFDKCRTDAMGCYGGKAVETPNLDFIASSGVRFDNCYTPQALCGPARASIITGLHPHAHNLRRNVYPFESSKVNSNYPEVIVDPFRDPRFKLWNNFPFFLNNAGYATAHIGKWHLGPANPGFFDYFKSFNSQLWHWIGEPHKSPYRPDVHTSQGIQFINQHASEPFFLYQSYYTPHEPLDPPREFLAKSKDREHAGYYGNVANLDWNVGRLLDALRKNNILDDTLIIVSTEHGRVWRPRPGVLEGMCVAYEEASRIPLLLRYPRSLPQGKAWKSGVTLVDLMPTIMEATGVRVAYGLESPGTPIPQHGRSLISQVRNGRDNWDRPVVLQNLPQAAIDGSLYEERAIRDERYKLILRKFDNRPEHRPGELYDLASDPGEERNLWTSNPIAVKQLTAKLARWCRDHQDSFGVELAERHS